MLKEVQLNPCLTTLRVVLQGCRKPGAMVNTLKVPRDDGCLYEFRAKVMSRGNCYENNIVSCYSDPVFYGKCRVVTLASIASCLLSTRRCWEHGTRFKRETFLPLSSVVILSFK